MQLLQTLLSTFAKRTNARWWAGDRPDVREGQLLKTILQQVGLPTAGKNVLAGEGLTRLSRAEAAHVLAVAGTTSLAYGQASPRKNAIEDANKALAGFAESATFIGNGRWGDAPSLSWTPLTSSTLECGVLGYDDDSAFIFWVEEED